MDAGTSREEQVKQNDEISRKMEVGGRVFHCAIT